MDAFGLKLITAPEVEPVSLANAKARLAVTITDMDTDLDLMIAECREAAEAECGGRAFITQTWSMFLDKFPSGRTILIPRPPLQTVTWVKYYDAAGEQQTLGAEAYTVAVGQEPGRLVLKASGAWPVTEAGRPEAVEVRFVCGYGGAAADVPAKVRAAVLLTLAARFDDPTGEVDIPPAARRVLHSLETGQVW